MTDQELRDRAEAFVREKEFNGLADRTLIKNWMAEFAKTYADARVAEMKAETWETERQLGLYRLMHSSAIDMLCAKDDEISALKAEIKWLREGIGQCIVWLDQPLESGDYRELGSMLDSLLSPAPVTEPQFSSDIDTIGNCANCGVEFHIHKIEPVSIASKNEDQV